ncbi:MAG: hypothetical protein QOH32_1434 [Bradyrhizobium sp.]|nr:hypothetical protein [Bradyrhizobium sp.]
MLLAALDRLEFAGFPGTARGLHLADVGKRLAELTCLVLHRQLRPPQRHRSAHRRYAFLDQREKQIDLILGPASTSNASH